uniref:Uncharacterized protein n=1 Tax=Anguilla anguilla TaxID=7936 RepID=A0A0E9U3K8_ANGAN
MLFSPHLTLLSSMVSFKVVTCWLGKTVKRTSFILAWAI